MKLQTTKFSLKDVCQNSFKNMPKNLQQSMIMSRLCKVENKRYDLRFNKSDYVKSGTPCRLPKNFTYPVVVIEPCKENLKSEYDFKNVIIVAEHIENLLDVQSDRIAMSKQLTHLKVLSNDVPVVAQYNDNAKKIRDVKSLITLVSSGIVPYSIIGHNNSEKVALLLQWDKFLNENLINLEIKQRFINKAKKANKQAKRVEEDIELTKKSMSELVQKKNRELRRLKNFVTVGDTGIDLPVTENGSLTFNVIDVLSTKKISKGTRNL